MFLMARRRLISDISVSSPLKSLQGNGTRVLEVDNPEVDGQSGRENRDRLWPVDPWTGRTTWFDTTHRWIQDVEKTTYEGKGRSLIGKDYPWNGN